LADRAAAGARADPLAPPRAPIDGDSHGRLLPPLEAVAGETCYTVVYKPRVASGRARSAQWSSAGALFGRRQRRPVFRLVDARAKTGVPGRLL
jgi:hypothetical protein